MERCLTKYPVALICDRKYIIPTAVAITSMVCNKKPDTCYDVYIIAVDLPDSKIEKFHELRGRNVNIHVIKASSEKYEGIFSAGYITPTACLKFELPLLIPDRDKVLYLDSDVIIRKDLSDLFDVDIDDCYAAAAKDYLLTDNFLNINNYFNSGVMLLNLKLMRENDSSSALLHLRKTKHDLKYMDQDCFNIQFRSKVTLFPVIYNCFYNSDLQKEEKHNLDLINECFKTNYSSWADIKNDSYIIHYVGYDKPWIYYNSVSHPEWYEYFKKSPFKFYKLKLRSVKLLHFIVSHNFTKLSYVFFRYWQTNGFKFAMGKVKKRLFGSPEYSG